MKIKAEKLHKAAVKCKLPTCMREEHLATSTSKRVHHFSMQSDPDMDLFITGCDMCAELVGGMAAEEFGGKHAVSADDLLRWIDTVEM